MINIIRRKHYYFDKRMPIRTHYWKKRIFVATLIIFPMITYVLMFQRQSLGPIISLSSPSKVFATGQQQTESNTSQPSKPIFHILIPKLNENIAVVGVGVTKNGEMAVPQDTNYAGWYRNGPKPGQHGNAVIDGHNQILGQGKGVFWNIDQLVPGDSLYIQNDTQVSQHFVITSTRKYDVAKSPLITIFGESNKAHLNLITCAGKWDKSINGYSQRLVVYADLVQ